MIKADIIMKTLIFYFVAFIFCTNVIAGPSSKEDDLPTLAREDQEARLRMLGFHLGEDVIPPIDQEYTFTIPSIEEYKNPAIEEYKILMAQLETEKEAILNLMEDCTLAELKSIDKKITGDCASTALTELKSIDKKKHDAFDQLLKKL